MVRRAWKWAVFRIDGSLVGVFDGQAHALRDLGIDRRSVVSAGPPRLERLIRDDVPDPYYMLRALPGRRPSLPAWFDQAYREADRTKGRSKVGR